MASNLATLRHDPTLFARAVRHETPALPRTRLGTPCSSEDVRQARLQGARAKAKALTALDREAGREPLHPHGVPPRSPRAALRDHDQRLRDGRIVEDWSSFDSLELLRQLGLVRTLRLAPRLLGSARNPRAKH
jgi:hypothetical protein